MNFGEAPKYEPGSLEESLAEANLPTDPRRLIDRGYKFTSGGDGKHIKRVFIGTIVGLRFELPHFISLAVSDAGVSCIVSYISDDGIIRWRLKQKSGEALDEGELKLL